MKIPNWFPSVLLSVVLTMLTTFTTWTMLAPPAAAELYTTVRETPHGMALGAADAPVTMVEYFSLGCGHCATFHANELPTVRKAQIDTGKLRLIFREFPHNKPSEIATRFARCVPAPHYLAFIERVLARQREWMSRIDFEVFVNVESQLNAVLGGDAAATAEIAACARKPETVAAVQRRRDTATASYFIGGVPSFVLGSGKNADIAALSARNVLSRISGPDYAVWTAYHHAELFDGVVKMAAGIKPPRLAVAGELETAMVLSLLDPQKDAHELAGLLAKGADANADKTFAPPLVIAAMMNKATAVAHLLAKGAKPNVFSVLGMSPLMFAVQHANTDMIGLLLKVGADPGLKGAGGLTALEIAKKIDRHDIVDQLSGGIKL